MRVVILRRAPAPARLLSARLLSARQDKEESRPFRVERERDLQSGRGHPERFAVRF